MDESPPYHLEIKGLEDDPGNAPRAADLQRRPWIGIHFECCGVYTRIYRNWRGTAYQGACPRCGGQVKIRVGPEGTDDRFFIAR